MLLLPMVWRAGGLHFEKEEEEVMSLAHLVEVVLGFAFVEPALFWQSHLPFVFEASPAFLSCQDSPLESWQTSPVALSLSLLEVELARTFLRKDFPSLLPPDQTPDPWVRGESPLFAASFSPPLVSLVPSNHPVFPSKILGSVASAFLTLLQFQIG